VLKKIAFTIQDFILIQDLGQTKFGFCLTNA